MLAKPRSFLYSMHPNAGFFGTAAVPTTEMSSKEYRPRGRDTHRPTHTVRSPIQFRVEEGGTREVSEYIVT